MKTVSRHILVAALCCTFALSAQAGTNPVLTLPAPVAEMTPAKWEAFSENLITALGSENEGLQVEAMRLAIQYASEVDVRAARFDLMRLYRDHENEAVRRMAVVTLGTTGDGWAMGFLRRSVQFEKSPSVRQTIAAVVTQK